MIRFKVSKLERAGRTLKSGALKRNSWRQKENGTDGIKFIINFNALYYFDKHL